MDHGSGSSDGSSSSGGAGSVASTIGESADPSGSSTSTGSGGADGGAGSTTAATTGSSNCEPSDCDAPFACSPGGYCASVTGVPQFDRVFVVIFENRSLTSVMGHAAYLDGLAAMGAYATAFNSVRHPSLPNYIAMTSGDTWGVACDCHPGGSDTCNPLSCNLLFSNCDCPVDAQHLGDQLDSIGVTWREYGESMVTPCNAVTDTAVHYATKHLPFMYYENVFGDKPRCEEHLRDFTDFPGDLAAASRRFSMISPNLCNDMHDACGGDPVQHGDAWAAANVATILGTPGFAADGRDVLFVVWDEQDNSLGTAPIPFIVVSPLVAPGTITPLAYDHYSLLATWEDGFGLPRLGHAAEVAPINDIWR